MVCVFGIVLLWFFFFKQKTAYEMRISDWSSDVCSSDLKTVDVWAEFPDGTWHLASADIEISDGVLTLTFAPELRVQEVDLSAGSDRPFPVRLPPPSDHDFQLHLQVTAQEYVVAGALNTNTTEPNSAKRRLGTERGTT